MEPGADADRRFLEEALERGDLTDEQAADCRRLLAALAEVDVALSAADVAVRKAFVTQGCADQIKRALARKRVGRYEVLDRLGRGGSGVVWRARDTRLGRIVALKLLARPRTPDDLVTTYQSRFQREARTAVTLNHVNIVRGLDYGEADGYVFFAMEFVSGESVAERMHREGRLPESDALQITLQVVEALEYVQRFGLVHRDLKPENLLLTATGEVKVCDLGLAKPTLEEASRMEGAGVIAGTPLYMAPEQIRDPDAIDWRTDVYGLGATLYHMLSGRPPFLPGGTSSVIQAHLDEPVSDPREHVLELSAGASAVVLKMLAKNPDRRYSSLSDLGSDLASVLDGRPPSFALSLRSGAEGAVEAVLATAQTTRARMATRRRDWRRSAAATAALASLVLLSYALWGPRPLPTEHDPSVVRAEAAVAQQAEEGGPSVDPDTVPDAPRADPGSSVLRRARVADRADAPLDELIERFEFVAETYAEYGSGTQAAVRLAELRERLGVLALEELRERRRRAKTLLDSGRHAAAADELVAFPELLQETDEYFAALNEATAMRKAGLERARELIIDANLAALDRRFDDARRCLADAERTGIRLASDELAAAVEQVRLAQQERDDERAARVDEFRVAAGRALFLSLDDVEAAGRLLDAAERDRLRTYSDDIAALRDWLPLAARARERLFVAWRRWAEEGRELAEFDTAGLRRRRLSGAAAAGPDGMLGVSTGPESVVAIRAEHVPVELLAKAVVPGASPDESGVDEMAAFLLATRRVRDAARLSAPPELIEAVRRAAIGEVQGRLERARTSLDSRDYRGARKAIDDALVYAPWHAPSWTLLGEIQDAQGLRDEAQATFARALEEEPNDPAAGFHLAAILEDRGAFPEAEDRNRRFLEETDGTDDGRLSPLRDRAQVALARVRERRIDTMLVSLRKDAHRALNADRGGEAAALFERILKVRPDDPDALLEAARLSADAGRIFPAYRNLRRLIDAHPEHPSARDAQSDLAKLEQRSAGVFQGRAEFRNARKLLAEGNEAEAFVALASSIRLAPFLVDAHVELARAHLERALRDETRDDLDASLLSAEDALLLDPESGAALLVRARVHLERGAFDRALADATRAEGRLGKRADAILVAGRAHIGLNQLEEALTRFDDAYAIRRFADPLYWKAHTYELLGRPTEALFALDVIFDDLGGSPPHLRPQIDELYQRLTE